MIRVRINGEDREIPHEMTVAELVKWLNIKEPATAVAVNETVIPRSEWEQTRIEENDRVEIIRIVAGG